MHAAIATLEPQSTPTPRARSRDAVTPRAAVTDVLVIGDDDSCSGGLLQLLSFAEVDGAFQRAHTADDVLDVVRSLAPAGVVIDMNADTWTDPALLVERLVAAAPCPTFVLHRGDDPHLPDRLRALGVPWFTSVDDAFEDIFEPLEAFLAAVRARSGKAGPRILPD